MRIPTILSLLLLVLALSGCGGETPPAPRPFQLAIQLENVSVEVIDELRVTFTPDSSAGAAMFQDIEPTAYEDGAIVLDVDDTGVLVMTINGDYVLDNADATDPNRALLVLEIWSDEEADRMGLRGPQVRATATRETEQIATGAVSLPGWPLPAGGGQTVRVPCRAGFETRCVP